MVARAEARPFLLLVSGLLLLNRRLNRVPTHWRHPRLSQVKQRRSTFNLASSNLATMDYRHLSISSDNKSGTI